MGDPDPFSTLRLHHGPINDDIHRVGHARLMSEVLGFAPKALPDDAWISFAMFEGDGRCAANVEAAILPLVVDGRRLAAAGIRSVAVDPRWRGRGLFRALMNEALSWCDAHADGPVLLYTEDPELYLGFGFQTLPQHAFVGAAPRAAHADAARRLDATCPADQATITRSFESRAPVSLQASLLVPASVFLTNLSEDGAPEIAYAAAYEAIIAFETDGDTLVVADVAAPIIPPLAELLGALGQRPQRIKTLFPPDRLGWKGEPAPEATGLMARGDIPAGMTRPFVFPPTAEF